MGVEVVSIMEFSGDPEELMSKMGTVEEVASRKAAEYGGVSSTAGERRRGDHQHVVRQRGPASHGR
jgi:hypothetical protein